MPFHMILLIAAFVLLLLAGLLSWPRREPPTPAYGTAMGWFGLAAWVLAGLVP